MRMLSARLVVVFGVLLLIAPFVVYADTSGLRFDTLNATIRVIANGVVRSTGYLMFTLAIVVFFWGIVQFIWNARNGADGKEATKGKQFMKWGLIALFVMFSFWGIVTFAQNVFQIQGSGTITVPTLQINL